MKRDDYYNVSPLLWRGAGGEDFSRSCLLPLLFLLPHPTQAQPPHRTDSITAAHAHYAANRYEQARTAYEAVLRTGPVAHTDSLAGYAAHRIAVTYYNQEQRDYFAAINGYQEAIKIRRAALGNNHSQVAKSLNNLGELYIETGRTEEAAKVLYEASGIYAAQPRIDTFRYVRTLVNLAGVAGQRQDHQLAADVADRAHALLSATTSIEPYYLALFHYNLSVGLDAGVLADRDRRHLLAAETYARADQWQALLPAVYNGLSINAEQRGDYELATQYLVRATDPALPADSLSTARYLNNLARLQEEKGAPAAALRTGRRARAFHQGDALLTAQADGIAAGAYFQLGDSARASALLDRCIAALRKLPADQSRETLIGVLPDRARYYRARGRPARALADYQQAIRLSETLRTGVSSDASRRFLSENLRPLYDGAVASAVAAYEATGNDDHLWAALLLSDRARAYVLSLRRQTDRSQLPVRVAELEREIGRLEALGDRSPAAENRLVTARLTLDRLRHQRTYAEDADTMALSRNWVADRLHATQKEVLEYHLSPQGCYGFYVDVRGNIDLMYLPPLDTLRTAVADFRDQLIASAYRRKSVRAPAEQLRLDSAFQATGQFLARALVHGKLRSNEWTTEAPVIIPDGVLSFLPFDALPLSEPQQPPLRHREIVYLGGWTSPDQAYSLRDLLLEDRPLNFTPKDELLAVAPAFSGYFAELTYTAHEVTAIGKLFPSHLLTGKAANRNSFLQLMEGRRVIHLSTHAYADAEHPNRSYVAFAQRGDSLQPDALLYFSEIATLDLPVELVVLSACETNVGRYAPGETSLSLASAFTAAGARSTLTTLWRVDDQAMAGLMTRFYGALAEGRSRSASLDEAAASLRDDAEYAHPYYWSGVVLTGRTGPVRVGSERPVWPWLLGGLLLLGGIGFGWRAFSGADAGA